MAVDLDVTNREGALSPGMFPTVKWPVRRSRPALFAPKTSVVTTTERTFVIRVQNGRAEWVDVKKGAAEGDLVEVMGNLKAADRVLRRGTDEMQDGAPIQSGPKRRGRPRALEGRARVVERRCASRSSAAGRSGCSTKARLPCSDRL